MSRQKWAGIIYGRTYNLDFRFITIPEDFSQSEINWASTYILATTRNARKLSASPRWSLFKNDYHCVVGVTCMVRDLMGSLEKDEGKIFSKDNRGRPLYVFVGYVTQLKEQQYLLDLPGYTGDYLGDFKHLYHYVEDVWQIKDYDRNSRQPATSSYQKPVFLTQKLNKISKSKLSKQLNHEAKFPDKVFLWKNNRNRNCRLWTTAARFPQPISLCLNIDSQRYLDSPFLNQTLTKLDKFTIVDKNNIGTSTVNTATDSPPKSNLTQAIADKVKEDIELTWQHANQIATASQGIVDTLTQPLANNTDNTQKTDHQSTQENSHDFGFKVKPSATSDRHEQDWF